MSNVNSAENSKTLFEAIKERSENANRTVDKGIINDKTGSSFRMDRAGNVTIAASRNTQYKMSYSKGQATELSLESNTITNRKNITTDDIVINNHKMNPYLWEWSDMKKFQGDSTLAIGNMTMMGTVLVKAWEPTLEKWVLIRRPIRTPLFSNALPVVGAPKGMDIDDNITTEITEGNNLSESLSQI